MERKYSARERGIFFDKNKSFPGDSKKTKKYYFYCVIQDATACCAQGLEFIWDDGTHSYPEEYPEDAQEIMVEGTFETYREEGDDSLYCRLKDASLTIEQE